MGDRVSIPRSFADQIGVADTLPSLRRHYLTITNNDTRATTGIIWGGGADTGIPLAARNVTFERILAAVWISTSFTGGSTAITVLMHNDATTTIFTMSVFAGTTTSGFWAANSTTPDNANVTAADLVRAVVTVRNAHATRVTVVVRFREALDS